MTRLMLTLPESIATALTACARDELRPARLQAALLLREGLERRGVLETQTAKPRRSMRHTSGEQQ